MSNLSTRRIGRAVVTGVAVLSGLLTGACTSAPGPGTASAPPTASASASTSTQDLVIDITIAGGKVTPNGRKIDAKVGQRVVMNVTSDTADEVHAHTGGDGYELEVPAGRPTTGSFTLTSAGSFEVESHHLEKIIVIVNAS